MIRYQATELTDTGYGRRFESERLGTAKDIVFAMGGTWRIRRQYKWSGERWRNDSGQRPEFTLSYSRR